jgi:hypothetical protein
MHPRANDNVTRLAFPSKRLPAGLAICLALLLFAPNCSLAAAQPPGPATTPEKLKAAFASLKAAPNSRAAQHHYLKAFPRTYTRFKAYFGTGGALADGYECDYIFALSTLQSHHVAEVGDLLVRLSKNAQYQANAPSCLQNVMAKYGNRYTKRFAGLLHQLSPQERGQLVAFLADAGLANGPEYQGILQNLRDLQETDLAKEFQQAQAERSRQSHG